MINKRLMSLSSDSTKWISITVLMNWISILCNIAVILIIGNVVDKIFIHNQSIDITKIAVLIIGLLVIRFIVNYYSVIASYKASTKARKSIREKIYKKILELGVNYNKNVSDSTILQVSVEGVEALEVYFSKYVPQLFYSLLAPITLFVIIFNISVKAAVLLLVCVPIIPVSIIIVMRIGKKILGKYWNNYTNLGESFLENLQGLTTLKIFDLDENKHNQMNEEAEGFRKTTMKVLSMQLNSITIMDLVAFLGSAIAIIIALLDFNKGIITVGQVIIIILLSSEFFIPLRLLGSYFHVGMNGVSACEKVFALLDTKVEDERELSKEEIESLNNISIKLSDVEFGYEENKNILNDININIANKKTIALVGESGSGKSTIVSLLTKKNQVNNGQITLNDININEIPFDLLSEKVGYISHNSYVFNMSIEENLRMAKQDATTEELYEVLKKVNLYNFVNNLKDKLKTNVEEGGKALSGGQRQRLALARMMLKNPEIYIFDEATSSIDVENEEQIWNIIHSLSKEKTLIIISHRLKNIVSADEIYVLKKGKIEQTGTHQSLMNDEGYYFNLFTHQSNLESVYDKEEI